MICLDDAHGNLAGMGGGITCGNIMEAGMCTYEIPEWNQLSSLGGTFGHLCPLSGGVGSTVPCTAAADGNACQNGGTVTGADGSCGCNCDGTGFFGSNCDENMICLDDSDGSLAGLGFTCGALADMCTIAHVGVWSNCELAGHDRRPVSVDMRCLLYSPLYCRCRWQRLPKRWHRD
jgi:hypothetical protein